jgi:lipopolysaccharide export system protein LptA
MRELGLRMGFAMAAIAAASLLMGAKPSPQSLPLIMENADRLEGMRSTGEYVLSGNVRFRHGDLRFETPRALWQRDQNKVSSNEGMRITNRGALLTSDRGSYDKAGSNAVAEGRVFMRDSANEVNGTSEQLVYNRVARLATMTGNPHVRRFYPATVSDSGKWRAPDTLTLTGRLLRYNEARGVADAEGDVVITRRGLRITCGRAEYHQKEDSLFLFDKPLVKVDDSEVRGQVMRFGLAGDTLRGLRVRGDAQAMSVEKATDSTKARQSKVTGDSLFVAFKGGSIDSVQVFTKAEGTYWELEKPQYVNQLNGNYMVLRFGEGEPREAEVWGAARSTYFHFEGDTLKGKNRAWGDTIAFGFRRGKVEDVLVKGSSQGVYEGRTLAGKSRADSLRTGKGKK